MFGRIPGFSKNIFPPQSLPYLNLTSTIALVLYLFVIGLETDVSTMRRLLKHAGPISLIGMLLPFGLGAALSKPIYDKFVDHDKVTFGHFLLFTCVAISITAFPGMIIDPLPSLYVTFCAHNTTHALRVHQHYRRTPEIIL